jgi:hypothetical protein
MTTKPAAEPKSDNEIIAKFMGSKPYNDGRYGIMWPDPTNENNVGFGLQYNTKWDWLMPVVEKIASLMPSIKIPEDLEALKNGTHGSEPYVDVISLSISSPISEIYEAVVKFIKWHNQHGK